MIELRHLDVVHFVNEQCRHLAYGCTATCDCIGLVLFHYIYMHAESVTLLLDVVQPFTT